MRIDLHTHSDRSDGTMSPTELVRHAVDTGVDVLGLTDHDTFEGWDEAGVAASRHGLTLVPGLEISCRYAGQSVHLLGYFPDRTYEPLTQELQRILDGRNSRVPAILHRLRGLGIEIDINDVRAVSQDAAATGRPHVADALVSLGVVSDRDEAFARFLGPRGPAYVDRYAADLEDMIRVVVAAGGVAVLAHPWAGRNDHRALTDQVFAQLRDAGLAGLEVDHEDHDPRTRRRLREIAAGLGLVATGSSDFHGTGKIGHDLGCNTTEPDQYARLLDRAAESAGAAVARGRSPAGTVGP